jgi:RHS repeat-associated protein
VTHGFGSTVLSYYRDDRIKQKTHDNGVTTEYDYDNYGNLSNLSHKQGGTVMHKFDYQYDANQNRTQETEFNGIDTLVTDFDYDQQDRLTTAIYAGDSQLKNNGTATYTYDDNSNRETETFTTAANVQSKNVTYGYDNNDQLTSIADSVESATTVVDYDTLGNLTQKAKTEGGQTQTTNYIYDARNQLKQVQMGGSTIGAFLYDANGLRVHKTETLTDTNTQIASTTQQRYHYQGLNVIGSFDEQNQSQYRYYHDGNQILARINESAFTDINVENNAVQTYHQDALGSTAVISNRDGSLTARYQYDAFGNVQTETGESESNDFTYTGHERDLSTGLIYAKARYYDPQLGLFLSRDPFEGYDNTPLSLHRYLYAYQNPMKYVDPDGREPVTLTAMALYAGWSGLNAGVNTGIDYGFHKVFGDERDEFNLGENLATNFAISATTGGVGAYAKHAPKLKKVGESAVEFSGEVYKEYNANKESGASIPQAAFDTAISMTIGKAASDSIGKVALKTTQFVSESASKLGTAVTTNVRGLFDNFRGKGGVSIESPEANFTYFNKTHKDSLPKPKGRGPNNGRLESHHGLQQQWAKENLGEYGYDANLAPSVTLETGKGLPHTLISNAQNTRRSVRVNSGDKKWSSSLQDELQYISDDMRAAEFKNQTVNQVLDQQYKMLDKLNVPYQKINN